MVATHGCPQVSIIEHCHPMRCGGWKAALSEGFVLAHLVPCHYFTHRGTLTLPTRLLKVLPTILLIDDTAVGLIGANWHALALCYGPPLDLGSEQLLHLLLTISYIHGAPTDHLGLLA